MKFIDEAILKVHGGKGGDGLISWRREKYKPLGGPDGGIGGNGGAVVFIADESVNTLIDYRFKSILNACDGESGGDNNKQGKSGTHEKCAVPVGTQFFYNDNLVADLTKPGANWVAARGGIGGKGNSSFVSSRRQAPYMAEKGQTGEELELKLVLKTIADVGFVGLPNAGKSSLLRVISAATPKVASYPFTTLTPHLGVVSVTDGKSFIAADIPGLIEGAHEGKGLGIQFLKHIERTKVLLLFVDTSEFSGDSNEKVEQALSRLSMLENELKGYSGNLAKKPKAVFCSKSDIEDNSETRDALLLELKEQGYKAYSGSSLTKEGLSELLFGLYELVQEAPKLTDNDQFFEDEEYGIAV